MNPTIDITAAVRAYDKRLASQADGSGNVSINHSWKTRGYLGEHLTLASESQGTHTPTLGGLREQNVQLLDQQGAL